MLTAIVVVVVLTALTAVYVAAEFSAVSVRRSKVRQMAEDNHFLAKRLAPFVADARRLDTYIAASQIGITLTSLILGAYGQATITPTVAEWVAPFASGDTAWARWIASMGPTWLASILTLLALTTFNVIVGELVPKTLALQHPTPVALATVMPMLWSLWIYRPFIGVLNGSGNLILRLFGVRQSGHRHVHSPEELELLIAESRDGGLLEPDEHRRLQRALRLRLRSARELMVPWVDVEVVDVAEQLDTVLERLSQSAFTRVPVFRDERTTVVGILNTKKLALRRLQGQVPGNIADLLQPAVTTSPTTTGDRLLVLFQQRRTHHAIVSDETGLALGLVTLEDVLRAFLGVMPDDVESAVPVPAPAPGAARG
jgi:CBS domain containing-hemolysin-like protein